MNPTLDPAAILPALDALREDVQAFQGASDAHSEAVDHLADCQAAVAAAQGLVALTDAKQQQCSDDVTAALAHLAGLISPAAAAAPAANGDAAGVAANN